MQRLISEKRKKRIFDIIQIGKRNDFISRAFDIFSGRRRGVKGTVSITVDSDSPFLNQSVQRIETAFGIDVIAFVRKGAVILPSDSIIYRRRGYFTLSKL